MNQNSSSSEHCLGVGFSDPKVITPYDGPGRVFHLDTTRSSPGREKKSNTEYIEIASKGDATAVASISDASASPGVCVSPKGEARANPSFPVPYPSPPLRPSPPPGVAAGQSPVW
jgi:hypothetical protein